MQNNLATFSPSSYTYISIDIVFKMVADAVVYHPTVAHYLRFVATTGTSWSLLFDMPPTPPPLGLVLTHSSPQLAAINSSVPFNTSHDSAHGTSFALTTLLGSSRPMRPSRSNLASRGKRYAWARMSSTSKPRPSRPIAKIWIQC